MKIMIDIKKIILFTTLFLLGISSVCFADVFNPIPSGFSGNLITTLGVVIYISGIITLFCIIIGKIIKSEKLYEKSKKIFGNIFYIWGLWINVIIIMIISNISKSFNIIMLLIIILLLVSAALSLYFRIQKKNKKLSCWILFGSLIIMYLLSILYNMFG